jgi:hypothetical protein
VLMRSVWRDLRWSRAIWVPEESDQARLEDAWPAEAPRSSGRKKRDLSTIRSKCSATSYSCGCREMKKDAAWWSEMSNGG